MENLSEIQDYIENLCVKHVDLLHSINNRQAFARFKTESHIEAITNNATPNIVVIAAVNGRRVGHVDDQETSTGVQVMFASMASAAGPLEAAVDEANDKSMQIMLDFISRMQYDQNEGCGLNFDLEKVSWEDIDGPWLNNYYGWILFLPFRGNMPGYDPDKWNE